MLFKEDSAARAQHLAVRENAGWYRWTHDTVELTGADADAFVDHMMVNTVAKAAVGQGKYTTMLDERGTIIDDLIAMHMGEGRWWLSTLYGPHMVRWFDRHRGDFDVSYQDITQTVDMYSVQGPNSAALMDKIVASKVDDLKRFQIIQTSIGDMEVTVDRGGFTGELGFEIYCSRDDSLRVAEAIARRAGELGAPRLDTLEVYVRALPMEKGMGLRQDYYGLTPYEANLGWSVHMDKDFVGKEALAASHEAGERHAFVGLEIDRDSYEDIAQGEVIYKRGIPVGTVRQFIYGYSVDKNIGFGVVDAGKAPLGTKVTIGGNDSPATVVASKWL